MDKTLLIIKNNLILLIILFIALLIRGINLDSNPPAMYGDELTLAYDSYSLLKTGTDQYGNFMPLVFATSEGRPPGYVYAEIPFIALFGPSELGVRSLSMLSGVGVVFLIYLLGRLIVSRKVGLFSAALMSISPWDISLSRGGFETNYALFLGLLGTVIFIQSYKKTWLIFLSAIIFVLAMFTYPTYKLTIPIFGLLLIWYTGGIKRLFSKKFLKYSTLSIILLVVAVVFTVGQSIGRGSQDRFLSHNIFSQKDLNQNIVENIDFDRNLNTLPNLLSVAFNNKFNQYIFTLGNSYIQNFNPNYLFVNGDSNPRHNTGSMGGLYLVEFITIIFGFWYLIDYRKNISLFYHGQTISFLTLWILIPPIATSLLLEVHSLRNSFMIPPLILISATGLSFIMSSKDLSIKILKYIIIIGLIIQFSFLIERTFFQAPNKFSRFWSYPAKSASIYAVDNKSLYDYVILSDRIDNIEFAYPDYAKTNPVEVITQNKTKTNLIGFKFKKLDNNIYIGYLPIQDTEKLLKGLRGNVLFISDVEGSKFLNNFKTYYNKDGLPAYAVSKFNNGK